MNRRVGELMKKIVIYGSGGFAREVVHLIEDINKYQLEWEVLGYLNDYQETYGSIINELPVLGGSEWLAKQEEPIHVVVGVGSSKGKKVIVDKLSDLTHISYPNLIHPTVNLSRFNTIGKGNIICEGSILTTNIKIGNFIIININCTIGHDVNIGNYTTILPNSSISGNVFLGECVDFGTNATIIERIKVGTGTIVGAGSVVVKDLPPNCTAVGSPAKPIKFHE